MANEIILGFVGGLMFSWFIDFFLKGKTINIPIKDDSETKDPIL